MNGTFARHLLLLLAISGSMILVAADRGREDLLDDDDRKEIALLGSDVMGDSVELGPIAKASDWLPLAERKSTFKFTSGDDRGKTVVMTEHYTKDNKQNPKGHTGPSWVITDPKTNVSYIQQDKDGNLHMPTQVDLSQKVVSTFDPPEPILLEGVKPGESRTTDIKVEVYDISDPDTVSHSGSMKATYTDLGGFKITVPAGTWDARLVRTTYEGKIGPASVSDSVYRFYAKGVGCIAAIDRSHISAFLVYNKSSNVGRILMKEPTG